MLELGAPGAGVKVAIGHLVWVLGAELWFSQGQQVLLTTVLLPGPIENFYCGKYTCHHLNWIFFFFTFTLNLVGMHVP